MYFHHFLCIRVFSTKELCTSGTELFTTRVLFFYSITQGIAKKPWLQSKTLLTHPLQFMPTRNIARKEGSTHPSARRVYFVEPFVHTLGAFPHGIYFVNVNRTQLGRASCPKKDTPLQARFEPTTYRCSMDSLEVNHDTTEATDDYTSDFFCGTNKVRGSPSWGSCMMRNGNRTSARRLYTTPTMSIILSPILNFMLWPQPMPPAR